MTKEKHSPEQRSDSCPEPVSHLRRTLGLAEKITTGFKSARLRQMYSRTVLTTITQR